MKIHQISVAEALSSVQGSVGGLPYAEGQRRLAEHGANVVHVDVQVRGRPKSPDQRDRAAVGLLGLESASLSDDSNASRSFVSTAMEPPSRAL